MPDPQPGISQFGERGLSGGFGWDDNEIHRKIFVEDPSTQLLQLLQKLFGDDAGADPHELPTDWGLTDFFAWRANFDLVDAKGSQGDTDTPGDLSFLDAMPSIRGGVEVDIVYRPMDDSGQYAVVDEAWDFSAQTMSMIGNNYGQNANSLTWASDGTAITNISAIVKILPKVEILQRQIYVPQLPNATQRGLIGSVNDGTVFCGAAGSGAAVSWPEQCLLLVGLPSIRRWRFDGQQIFEIGVKLAANTYKDILEDSDTYDFVTWNRLYRPDLGTWDQVYVGPPENQTLLYPLNDLSQVIA